ncbi:hypothetical protein [Qipengyuania sp. 483]
MPTELDYGSIADWVAGVGTLLAVVAALWIAGAQNRAAKADRRRANDEDRQRSSYIIREAIHLGEKISAECQSILDHGEELAKGADLPTTPAKKQSEFINTTATIIAKLHEMQGLRQQLLALQTFKSGSVSAFVEISRLVYETDIGYTRNIDPTKVPKWELLRVMHDVRNRMERLAEIRSDLNKGTARSWIET